MNGLIPLGLLICQKILFLISYQIGIGNSVSEKIIFYACYLGCCVS